MTTYLICNEYGNLVKVSELELLQMSSTPETLASVREKYKKTVELYRTFKRFEKSIPISSRAYRILRYFRDGLTLLGNAYISNIGGPNSPNLILFTSDNFDATFAENTRVKEYGEWDEVKVAIRKILNYLESKEEYEACAELRTITKTIGQHQLIKAIGKA